MSLYGGIKFATGEAESSTTAKGANVEGQTSNSAGPSIQSITSKPPVKLSAGYSAALKFAPRIPKPKAPSQPARPAGTYTAAQVIEKQPDLLRSVSTEDEVLLGPDGRPLARAPVMTLAAEAKAKGGSLGMKRDRDKEEERRRKKKKRQKQKQQQQFISNFNPDDLYDPNRPNDLGEYQQYRKRLRAEKRPQAVAEKLRREGGGRSSDESSYYTDSEEEAPRRDAPRMFEPPKLYSPPPSIAPPPTTARRAPSPPAYMPPAPPSPPFPPRSALPASASSGDDAYARRAALSHQVATGDDAYARRAALSQAQSGDDAYAQRAALAGQPLPIQPIALDSLPPFPPSSVHYPAHSPSFAAPASVPAAHAATANTLPEARLYQPVAPQSASNIPGLGGYRSQLETRPPSLTTVTAPPAEADSGAATKTLEARMAAAAAIAAKYAHLAAGPSAPLATSSTPALAPERQAPAISREDETGTFAEKMMKRWGHVEGTGIGARSDGIVHALAAEHVQKQLDPSKMSKRQLAKQKAAAANAKKRKWVQAPTTRGKIVNTNEDIRAAAEKDKLGEPSRVVCLTGLVESEDEVDEELSDEIGEECSKWGIVERVVLHMVEPAPEEAAECLRVFVVFSGLAGAWRAAKELDGRFFGGRKIAVKYFDEGRFDSSDRDGAIL